MKEYAVTITVPAYADMVVAAETREAAIAQIKENLASGIELDFEMDVVDPEDMYYFAYPLDESQNSTGRYPELKDFTVTLEAESYQEVPVKAVSEAAALQLVHEMYNCSDAIDFNDSHVVRIKPGIKEDSERRIAMKKLLEKAVRMIRESDCSNAEMADILQNAIDEVFGVTD